MKKTLIILLATIGLAGIANAKDRCTPSIGNWVNAAVITCPDQGSGAPPAYAASSPKKCN